MFLNLAKLLIVELFLKVELIKISATTVTIFDVTHTSSNEVSSGFF